MWRPLRGPGPAERFATRPPPHLPASSESRLSRRSRPASRSAKAEIPNPQSRIPARIPQCAQDPSSPSAPSVCSSSSPPWRRSPSAGLRRLPGRAAWARASRSCRTAGRSSRPAAICRSATCRSAMIESPDGNYLIITNNGYAKPTLTVVDLSKGLRQLEDHVWITRGWAWRGIRTAAACSRRAPARRRSTSSTGRRPADDGRGVRAGPRHAEADAGDQPSRAGRAELRRRHRDFGRRPLHLRGPRARRGADDARPEVRAGEGTVDVGAEPYTCVVSPDGKTVVVSVWGGAKVLMFDAATLEKRGEVAVGEHPNAMVWSKDAGGCSSRAPTPTPCGWSTWPR